MVPLTIEKEKIPYLSFPEGALPKAQHTLLELTSKLLRAMLLGDNGRNKCSIIFKDLEGLKKVIATIRSFDSRYVNLKGGITLSLNNIEDVIIS
ncbi:MAG TPA: hypothetical protein PKY12_13645 [Catalimonadaceae bacterium]|nr:hypothetical protein [Catalimonadaceae bacterium]